MAYIDNNFIEQLLNQTDIVQIINKRIPLKKTGMDYRAPCPFHQGKNKNLAVNTTKGFYHCFKCGASGNVVKFVQEFDNLDFPQAIEKISEEVGIAVVYDESNKNKTIENKNKSLYDITKLVNDFYQKYLRTPNPVRKKVVSYIKNRNISREVADVFELGFAPPGWDNLTKQLKDNIEELKAVGLVVEKEETKRVYDRFRDRLLFPIHNRKGDVVGFGGRVLNNQEKPKYLNSPESPIFHKQFELYGLYQAKKYTKNLDSILVVEGYMDVISLHQKGITNTVATLGTSVSKQHLKTLSQITKTIVFCFDGDDAGQKAAWRALIVSLPIIDTNTKILFLFLPNNEDPDSWVQKKGKKHFLESINSAISLSKFLFKKIKKDVDFKSVEGRSDFVSQIVELINQVNNIIFKQQLKQELANQLKQELSDIEIYFHTSKKEIQPIPEDYFNHQTEFTQPLTNIIKTQNNQKALTKAIILVFNFPSVAELVDFSDLKTIQNSEVLLKLLEEAELEPTITKEELLKNFKGKILARLIDLSNQKPINCFNLNNAQNELIELINQLKEQQNKNKIKTLKNKQNKTKEDELEIQKHIIKKHKVPRETK